MQTQANASRKFGTKIHEATQHIGDFPDLLTIRDEAKAFASIHAKSLAAELIQWQDTGLLPDGKLRELAKIWAKIEESNAMSLAESTATRAAFDALVRS